MACVETGDQPDPWQDPPSAPGNPQENAPDPAAPEGNVDFDLSFDAAPDRGLPPNVWPTNAPPPGPYLPPPPARRGRVAAAWFVIMACMFGIAGLVLYMSHQPPVPTDAVDETTAMALIGKITVGMEAVLGNADAQMLASLEQQAYLSAYPERDAMRIAIVSAEINNAQVALDRLERVSKIDDPFTYKDALDFDNANQVEHYLSGDMLDDHALLLRIYGDEAYVPTKKESDGLIERHGWFGELAAGYNLPSSDPLHQGPRSDAKRILMMLLGFVLIVVLAFLIGIGLFITFIILAANGKLRAKFMPGELVHRSAYLELVAVFLLTFIVIQLLAGVAIVAFDVDLTLPMLLLLVPPVFWPLCCGISWKQYRRDMGLFAPRGVTREVAAGIVGYLAGLPIIFVGMIATVILAWIMEMTGTHPAQQEMATGGTYEIIVLVLATIVWAPLVEELVFRAAFYRHLRRVPGWATWLSATLMTSFIFAAIHPQGLVGIPVLMSIAFVLAGLRQWRGSLVAPITAHALHNGAIIGGSLMLLYL